MQPIFVGDVQGCADELEDVLARAEERYAGASVIWLVGDLVNRGPASHRVLARVRDLVERGRARCVMGNHELAFLSAALGLRALGGSDTMGDVLGGADVDDWVEWVRRLPLVEEGVLGERRFAMVHASVHPSWDLQTLLERAKRAEARLARGDHTELRRFLATAPEDDEDRDILGRLTSCRSVSPDGRWSKREPVAPSVPWHVAWSERDHDYGVVYGHWAMQGLHVAPGLRGLDTGCVHHGRDHDGFLTAWLPDPARSDPFAVPDERFWQVRAHARYYVVAPSAASERA